MRYPRSLVQKVSRQKERSKNHQSEHWKVADRVNPARHVEEGPVICRDVYRKVPSPVKLGAFSKAGRGQNVSWKLQVAVFRLNENHRRVIIGENAKGRFSTKGLLHHPVDFCSQGS